MTRKVCCVCEKVEASYKCPVCRESYCSAVCCKKHRAGDNCKEPPKADMDIEKPENVSSNHNFPTEDTVPVSKLEQLCHSVELKKTLENPHVRHIMQAILTDENPTKAIALAMTEPIFVEMADACLRVVEPADDEKPC